MKLISEMTPIIRKGVRILRPSEATILINHIPKKDYRSIFRALLFTGMRYIEMIRFQRSPSWFDGEFIYLPKESIVERKGSRKMKKLKTKNKTYSIQRWKMDFPEAHFGFSYDVLKGGKIFKESLNKKELDKLRKKFKF